MKNLISDNAEFLEPVAAIALGLVIGFSSAHFIQTRINKHVFNTCESKKIVAVRMLLTTKSFYCLDQTD
jgi:hypothetical protein